MIGRCAVGVAVWDVSAIYDMPALRPGMPRMFERAANGSCGSLLRVTWFLDGWFEGL
jgi:hypothetical protein